MYSNEDLVMSVFSLFGAGTVTTSNTLVFFLLILAKHPHIQGKGSRMWLIPVSQGPLEDPLCVDTKTILPGSPKPLEIHSHSPEGPGYFLPLLHPCLCGWTRL